MEQIGDLMLFKSNTLAVHPPLVCTLSLSLILWLLWKSMILSWLIEEVNGDRVLNTNLKTNFILGDINKAIQEGETT